MLSSQLRKAKEASYKLAIMSSAEKNDGLLRMAENLEKSFDAVSEANKKDLAAGEKEGLSAALLDRLDLNRKRFDAMVQGVKDVAALEDPVGEVLEDVSQPNGIRIQKVKVPIGVIGIIYESRPNVTADAAALCLKAGNSVVLRGGKEAFYSNTAIISAMLDGFLFPEGSLSIVETTDRSAVKELTQAEGVVDLIIPRGGEGLIKAVSEMARVPVIRHYKGLCHIYVEKSAVLNTAVRIVENAKVQRPGVCNAVETLLIDEEALVKYLPDIVSNLKSHKVELRGDEKCREICPELVLATEEDWNEEYLDLILSIKAVSGVDEAITHINYYGSHHSDAVITEDEKVKSTFLAGVDSSSVYVNTSTRFTDGAAFGLGAEIGISTDKLHARGPMGLRELTTYKFIVTSDGVVRE